MALVFPNEASFCAALKAGLVPADVQRAAVRYHRTATGELELEPVSPLSALKAAALKNAGVTERAATAKLAEAPCWAAALQPVWGGTPDLVPPLVLFVVEDATRLLPLCGELLRLGCDRQEIRMLPGNRALVRVREAPFFAVARALEPKEQLEVFGPTEAEGLWLQLGYHHPLLSSLARPADGTVLVHGDGRFEAIADGPFTPLDTMLFPVGLPATKTVKHDEAPPRLAVRMRLVTSSKTEEPSLWVVREGVKPVESLVRSAPQETLDGILFAIAGPLVLLKVRAGREKAVAALPGDGFVRVAELPNLFAPHGTLLEPPLSRERLREWLAPDADQVVWLEAGSDVIVRHAVAESAFLPLSNWVDYVIDTSAPELEAWVRSSRFDFRDYEGPAAPADSADARAATAPAEEGDEPRPRKSPSRKPPSKQDLPKTPSSPALSLQPPQTVSRPIAAVEEQLAKEEAAFLSLDAPADSPERLGAWARLAGLYTALQRDRESGLAWAHAMWEAPQAGQLAIAQGWAQAAGSSLPALLGLDTPTEAQTRAVVAQLSALAVQRDASARARLPEAQAWLDKHDDNLDVRSLWLGRVALSQLAGNDALGLARARDRVLTKLRRGLSLERDVPRFVRSAGPGHARDAMRVDRVVQQLEQMLKAFDDTPRKKSTLEAPWPLTRAYIGYTFAWGFARLGNAVRARELERLATAAIDLSKPLHAVLQKAYSARIAQALEGLAPTTPLPAEHAAVVNALQKDDRFKLDRLRQHAVVLEPHELFTGPQYTGTLQHAYADYAMRANVGPPREDLSALRELEDLTELARAIDQRIVQVKGATDPDDQARLLTGLVANLTRLPEVSGTALLQRLVATAETLPAPQRSEVLEGALQVAAHFGHSNLARQLLGSINGVISELGARGATRIVGLLIAGLRTMRRTGLKEEAGALLQRAASIIKGENLETLGARLGLAGGFAYLGRVDLMRPVVEEALGHLSHETSPLFRRLTSDTTYLARNIARALVMAPAEVALPGLRRLIAPLPWLTDIYSTNTYFCLSLVELADIIVVGHVGEDLTLSEVTRTFLEEDEYRVRRRIHREVGQ